MGTIKAIIIRTADGAKHLEAAHLQENWGIAGDKKAGGAIRQVAFSDVDAGREGGLCGPRYTPNIEVEGLDFSQLKEGDMLLAGGTHLVIRKMGKECFDGCPILEKKGRVCYLKTHCGFAQVKLGGEIKVGQPLYKQE